MIIPITLKMYSKDEAESSLAKIIKKLNEFFIYKNSSQFLHYEKIF